MRLDTDLVKINVNLVVCMMVTTAIDALVAETLSEYGSHENATLVGVASFITYTAVFSALFWWGTRARYPHMSHGRIIRELGNVIKSMGTGMAITIPQMWILIYVFLELGVPPYMAAIAGKIISDATFMFVVSAVLRKTHTF